MPKQKPEREIKGEVEGYSREITKFPGNRGSRGMRIENKWHNMIGYRDFLEFLDSEFPTSSFVKFTEIQNNKGYWDLKEGTLRKISKKEAYNKQFTENESDNEESALVEEVEVNKNKLKYDVDMDRRMVKISGFKTEDAFFDGLRKIKKALAG